MTVIKLSNKQIQIAAKTLASAFQNDPLMLWMFDGAENYAQNAQWAIETWVKWCVLYGVAVATPQFESVALRKYPGKHAFKFWDLLRSGMWKMPPKLGSTIFDRVMLFDRLSQEAQLKNMGSDQFWYCWLIGTDPNARLQGHAKTLMDYTFKLADESHLPCYLETANPAVHEKRGYRVVSTIAIPDSDIEVYCMRKEASSTS